LSVQWIIADVDGCLAPEESVPWDLDAFTQLAAVWRRASAGASDLPPMTLCTGRPQPYAEVLMKLLDVRGPAICESGAVIYTLSGNHARYGPGVTATKIKGLRALRRYVEQDLLPKHPGVVVQFGKEAQLSLFADPPRLLEPVRRELEEWVERHGGPAVEVTMSHFYLNVSLASVSKGAAVRMLMTELGVERHAAAGIGDTEGDLPLRDAVGFFACPANATEAIRAVADYVSPFPTVQGVLDILRRPEVRRR
jgi:hypothetical protein